MDNQIASLHPHPDIDLKLRIRAGREFCCTLCMVTQRSRSNITKI